MTTSLRTWKAIKSGAAEGEQAVKMVTATDFAQIRSMRLNEQPTGGTKISYKLAGMWFAQSVFRDTIYETIDVPGAGNMQIEGAPQLPQEGLFVAIPENADVTEVVLLSKEEEDIIAEHLVRPASKPVQESEEPTYIPNKEIYENDEPYPGRYFEFIGTKRVAGRKVAHIMLYLAQYCAKSRRFRALKSIQLEVRYLTEAGKDAVCNRRIMRRTPVENLILDAQTQGHEEMKRIGSDQEAADDDESLRNPSNEGHYLIITTEHLEKSVKPLVVARENNYAVKVVTKAMILKEFPTAKEDEAIRDFLIHASDNWHGPPYWVVLAGDTPDIPTHVQQMEGGAEVMASDHFYSDLRGDLTPELVVSRLSASDPGEMERICVRAASHNLAGGQWTKKLLFLTFNRADYVDCKNDVAATVGDRYEIVKRYDGQATKNEVIEVLNEGVGLVNYRGHGQVT